MHFAHVLSTYYAQNGARIGDGKNETRPGLEGEDGHASNYSLWQVPESRAHPSPWPCAGSKS